MIQQLVIRYVHVSFSVLYGCQLFILTDLVAQHERFAELVTVCFVGLIPNSYKTFKNSLKNIDVQYTGKEESKLPLYNTDYL